METQIWVNISSGNALLPYSTKLLPEPMMTFICEVLWHSFQSNFTDNAHYIILYEKSKNYI